MTEGRVLRNRGYSIYVRLEHVWYDNSPECRINTGNNTLVTKIAMEGILHNTLVAWYYSYCTCLTLQCALGEIAFITFRPSTIYFLVLWEQMFYAGPTFPFFLFFASPTFPFSDICKPYLSFFLARHAMKFAPNGSIIDSHMNTASETWPGVILQKLPNFSHLPSSRQREESGTRTTGTN